MHEIISRFNILNQKSTQTSFRKLGNNFILGVVVKLVVVKLAVPIYAKYQDAALKITCTTLKSVGNMQINILRFSDVLKYWVWLTCI